MYAFKSGGALVVTLAAMACSAASAAAQQRQARQPVPPQTPNDDLRLETELGFEYRLSPQWRLRLDSKLALDHDVSRARNLELRPGVEYAITPNWAVVGGYVQYQPYTTQIPALRGPFQDIAYGMDFGHLALANRVRMEELFFDTNGALLVRARYRLSAQHPIGDSPWSILVSDETLLQPQDRRHGPQRRFRQEQVLRRAHPRYRSRRQAIGRIPVHHGGTDRRPQRVPHDQAGLRLRPQLRTAAAVPG